MSKKALRDLAVKRDKERIQIAQYKSLRENFKKMYTQILGTGYYNIAQDVYGADACVCEDIGHKFTDMKVRFKASKILNLVLLLVMLTYAVSRMV